MLTECPKCNTVFRLSQKQLSAAKGHVKCGTCKTVFNAKEVSENENMSASPTAADNTQQPSANTFHENNTQDIEAGFTGSNLLSDHENQELFTTEKGELIPEEFRIGESGARRATTFTMAWLTGIILLSASLFTEIIYFNRNNIAQNQEYQGLLSTICGLTDCDNLSLRDPEQIEMVDRNIYTHPNADKALMVKATLINHAIFAQPYPIIKIDFSDVRGNTVASRQFKPEEYLNLKDGLLRLFQPDSQITFDLEIYDPEQKALTYEFSFL